MLYRRFGRTEIEMPVLSCGGMRYQQSWKDGDAISEENQANLEATVERALELGITHLETARGYGTSERQLGRILPRLPRERLILQTKVAPCPEPEQFERDVLDSLTRLRVDYVDLLGLHGINDWEVLDWAIRPHGCLQRALQLKERGLVRHVGFSTHGSTDVIVDAIRDGRFEYVNLHYYWVLQDNLQAVREAAERDMGVFIISPSDKGGRLYDPPQKLCQLTEPLSPMVYNDLFCLANPEIHTISVGAARPGDFDAHVNAVEILANHIGDPRRTIAPIERRLRAELEQKLGREWMASWSEGLPAWGRAPGGVNVREILRLYNLAVGLDLLQYGRQRYNLLENGGHWFPGSPATKLDDHAWQEALQTSPHAELVIERLGEAHRLLAGEAQKRLQQD